MVKNPPANAGGAGDVGLILGQEDPLVKEMATQFSSVTQSCPTLCDPMDCITPVFSVHHQLLELAQPTPVLLPGKSHGQRNLVGYSPWGHIESDTAERLSMHAYICPLFFGFPSHSGFPGGSAGKVSACNAGDLGLIPGSGRSPGEGNGIPLQYPCLEKSHGWRSLVGYSH